MSEESMDALSEGTQETNGNQEERMAPRRRGRPRKSDSGGYGDAGSGWQVTVRFSNKREFVLGTYDSAQKAAKAYEDAMSRVKAVIEQI